MAAAVAPPRPTRISPQYSHAVSRSKELISCCKTAWKISQSQHATNGAQPIPSLALATVSSSSPPSAPAFTLLEDGVGILRTMKFGVQQLQTLVKRRGHTNDPTSEIALLTQQLEQDTQELTGVCESLLKLPLRGSQSKKHWGLVVQWFQQVATKHGAQVQEALKIRANILQEQAQQRKKITNSQSKRTNKLRATSTNPTPLFDSPLFQSPAPAAATAQTANSTWPPQNSATTSTTRAPADTSNPYARPKPTSTTGNGYDYYNSTSGAGYGGYYHQHDAPGSINNNAATGMRQRRPTNTNPPATSYTATAQDNETARLIQQRQQQRQTQQRLEEAQQAESKLGELGQLFGKMSTLISQQSEVLEKIEDDVEASFVDVDKGKEELTILYSIKKGNRPLIIKTFAILNFLIIFMRAYKK